MTKVVDMMRSYPDPSGNFPTDRTVQIAEVMRGILIEDIPECDMALAVLSFYSSISSDEQLGAWWLLRSDERSAWKKLLTYEVWLEVEKNGSH
jgi:hypothetical protein